MSRSIDFFEQQFQRQAAAGEFALNPFEQRALPFLRGRVLDYGCGLGNLALAAARQGCEVTALDAAPTAIDSLRQRAAAEALALTAREADLRNHAIDGDYDTVVCIGLLMFFDCAAAERQLARLAACLRPGGVAVVNVLVEGTSYREMFDPQAHCLFTPACLDAAFAGWTMLADAIEDFAAPGGTIKRFATRIARRPGG